MNEVDIVRDFRDVIKDKIKGQFASLIPEESWNELITVELNRFLKDDLPRLVNELAREEVKKILQTEMQKPEWQENWTTSGKTMASDAVEALIKRIAPDILTGMFGGLVQQMVDSIKYSNPTQW